MLEPSAMFSLYRSWLLREPPDSSAPPDVWLDIGGTRFAAHSSLLATHSGYLRAALCSRVSAAQPPDTAAANSPLVVPNITPEQFAPLLAYMYSGHLDLNPENIFAVLLASHVLHIPRALDLCRSFLAQHQLAPEPLGALPNFNAASHGIIKPIASRHPIAAPVGPAVPPVYQGLFQSSQNTSFRALDPVSENKVDAPATVPSSSNEPANETKIATNRTKQRRQSSSGAQASKPRTSTSTNVKPATQPSQQRSTGRPEEGGDKVIVDIASCDGPVRFSRVLNTAYNGGAVNPPTAPGKVNRDSDRAIGGSSFNTQMAENIRNYSAEFNRSEASSSDSEEINIEDVNTSEKSLNLNSEVNSANGEVIYTCVYCKHTFKSQYCYQKHTRRHLHPVESNQQPAAVEVAEKQPVAQEAKREVRPLDMNVQYYPCKTCGSKFPSYYFVHKHRKMCHSEDSNGLV